LREFGLRLRPLPGIQGRFAFSIGYLGAQKWYQHHDQDHYGKGCNDGQDPTTCPLQRAKSKLLCANLDLAQRRGRSRGRSRQLTSGITIVVTRWNRCISLSQQVAEFEFAQEDVSSLVSLIGALRQTRRFLPDPFKLSVHNHLFDPTLLLSLHHSVSVFVGGFL
jgi:hypothetical protein